MTSEEELTPDQLLSRQIKEQIKRGRKDLYNEEEENLTVAERYELQKAARLAEKVTDAKEPEPSYEDSLDIYKDKAKETEVQEEEPEEEEGEEVDIPETYYESNDPHSMGAPKARRDAIDYLTSDEYPYQVRDDESMVWFDEKTGRFVTEALHVENRIVRDGGPDLSRLDDVQKYKAINRYIEDMSRILSPLDLDYEERAINIRAGFESINEFFDNMKPELLEITDMKGVDSSSVEMAQVKFWVKNPSHLVRDLDLRDGRHRTYLFERIDRINTALHQDYHDILLKDGTITQAIRDEFVDFMKEDHGTEESGENEEEAPEADSIIATHYTDIETNPKGKEEEMTEEVKANNDQWADQPEEKLNIVEAVEGAKKLSRERTHKIIGLSAVGTGLLIVGGFVLYKKGIIFSKPTLPTMPSIPPIAEIPVDL